MPTSVHLITYEESLLMPENKLEEILDGESRIMPPPTPRHFLLIRNLERQLEHLMPGYEVCPAHFGVGIRRSPLRYRIPDVSVFDSKVFTENVFQTPGDPYVWIAPILIAECLSPSNRKGKVDELIQDYKTIDVPEVWLFYPEKRELQGYGFSELSKRIDLDSLWTAFHGQHG